MAGSSKRKRVYPSRSFLPLPPCKKKVSPPQQSKTSHEARAPRPARPATPPSLRPGPWRPPSSGSPRADGPKIDDAPRFALPARPLPSSAVAAAREAASPTTFAGRVVLPARGAFVRRTLVVVVAARRTPRLRLAPRPAGRETGRSSEGRGRGASLAVFAPTVLPVLLRLTSIARPSLGAIRRPVCATERQRSRMRLGSHGAYLIPQSAISLPAETTPGRVLLRERFPIGIAAMETTSVHQCSDLLE